MIRAAPVALGLLAPIAAAGQSPSPVPETEDVLPAGPGRDAVFPLCTACHASAVIRRSGLTRERRDELVDWMTDRHGMPPLEGGQRRLVVDCLAEHFPSRRTLPAGRQRNPFLPD